MEGLGKAPAAAPAAAEAAEAPRLGSAPAGSPADPPPSRRSVEVSETSMAATAAA